MRDFAEGMLLPFRCAWIAFIALCRLYSKGVGALPPKLAGFVHATVFMGIGQCIAMIILRKHVSIWTFLGL